MSRSPSHLATGTVTALPINAHLSACKTLQLSMPCQNFDTGFTQDLLTGFTCRLRPLGAATWKLWDPCRYNGPCDAITCSAATHSRCSTQLVVE